MICPKCCDQEETVMNEDSVDYDPHHNVLLVTVKCPRCGSVFEGVLISGSSEVDLLK